MALTIELAKDGLSLPHVSCMLLNAVAYHVFDLGSTKPLKQALVNMLYTQFIVLLNSIKNCIHLKRPTSIIMLSIISLLKKWIFAGVVTDFHHTACFVFNAWTERTYQALKRVFHHISKHLEVRKKYSAVHRILNSRV